MPVHVEVRSEQERSGLAVESRLSAPLERAATRIASILPTLTWLVLAAGTVLRLGRYLDNRSLWLDESFLAVNVTGRSWSDLFGTLDFLQTAPVGFLLAVKSAVRLFGDGELSLRLVPLASSIAALVLFQAVARRVLPPLAALLALVLFASSPVLLYQSSELKQYSSDVAVALLLVWLALRAEREGSGWRALLPLALVGPVAVWFSFPAIIVLGAASATIAVRAVHRGDRRRTVAVTALAAMWLASFGAVYAVASSNVGAASEALFSGEGTHGGFKPADVVHGLWSTFVDPGGFRDGTNALAVLLALAGLLWFARRREIERLVLLGLPVVLAVLAAFLDKYPLGGRFSLFLVPFLFAFVAAGVALASEDSRSPATTAMLLTLFIVAPPVARAAADLVRPPSREDVKPLLRTLVHDWRAGDALYVFRNTQYALRYYATCKECDPPGSSFPWPTRLAPSPPAGEEFAPALESAPPTVVVGAQGRPATEIAADLDLLPATGRVWFLFSHVTRFQGVSEDVLLLSAVEKRGRLLEKRTETGASLYLYELRAAADG